MDEKSDAGSKTELSAQEQSKPWQFQPGQSGNPKGRPKGSKNKLSQAIVGELLQHFDEHGHEAVERVFETDPAAYLRVITSLVPKGIEVAEVSGFDGMSEEELDTKILENTIGLLESEGFRHQLSMRGIEVTFQDVA